MYALNGRVGLVTGAAVASGGRSRAGWRTRVWLLPCSTGTVVQRSLSRPRSAALRSPPM